MLNINISKKYCLLILAAIYLCLQLPFLTTITNVWVDEPWYANTAYNYSIGNGLVNTVPGKQGGDDLFMYTFLLGSFYKFVGASLYTSRLFSVLVGLVSLLGLILVLKKLNLSVNKVFFISLLFIFSNVTYIVFRTVRPEAMVLGFLIWAFYFLLLGENSGKWVHFLVSGLLISFSLLCHPNGALLVFLFLSYLIYKSAKNRRYPLLLGFLLGGAIAFLILLYQVTIIKEMNFFEFLRELTTQEKRFNRSSLSSDSSFLNFFTLGFEYIKNWVEDYMLGFKRLFILIFEFGILFYGLSFYRKNKLIFQISAAGILYFVLSNMVFHPFILRAFGNVLFFSLITLGLILSEFELKPNKKKVRLFILVLGMLYLLNNIAGDAFIIKRDYKKTQYSNIEKELDESIPDDKVVLSLFNFWFAFKNNEMYADYTSWKIRNYRSLEEFIASDKADYVVISDYMTTVGGTTSGRTESSDFLAINENYYNQVLSYSKNEGELIKQIPTNNYGNIQIYKMK